MDILERIEYTIYIFPGIILGFIVHEFAHALIAHKLGDPTPKEQNKLNLKPNTHIDLIGIFMIIILGFGWAKPVETNPNYLKKPRLHTILISIAGPFSNLFLAIFLCASLSFLQFYQIINFETLSLANDSPAFNWFFYLLTIFILHAVHINVMLFMFNLLPFPPLDGFHVVENLLPSSFYKILAFLHKYGFIILILLLVVFSSYFLPYIDSFTNFLFNIFNIDVTK
ncbi:MAG: site-2 protease family protein [Clostridiales bacterium]